MNRTMRVILMFWVVLILAVAGAHFAAGQQPPNGEPKQSPDGPIAKSANPAPVPAAESKPVPPQFLKAWEKFKQLVELRNEQQRRREQAIAELAAAHATLATFNGQIQSVSEELRRLIPEGFDFDPEKKAFVPKAPSAPSAPK